LRRRLTGLSREWLHLGMQLRESNVTRRFTPLTRAMRSRRPGAVFAYAAATGETDPLLDPDIRLFIGLPA
jgi:hypothetical protein